MLTSTYVPRPSRFGSPGFYRFRDGTGRVIYVGKAKSLLSPSTPYLRRPVTFTMRTPQWLTESLLSGVGATEVDALRSFT